MSNVNLASILCLFPYKFSKHHMTELLIYNLFWKSFGHYLNITSAIQSKPLCWKKPFNQNSASNTWANEFLQLEQRKHVVDMTSWMFSMQKYSWTINIRIYFLKQMSTKIYSGFIKTSEVLDYVQCVFYQSFAPWEQRKPCF